MKKTVLEAFIRGLIEGEDFKDSELRRGFAEIFSHDFLDKLKLQQPGDNLDELYLRINSTKLKTWFEKLMKILNPK